MEAGPDFFREVFSHLTGVHKIAVDFWRDTRIPVNKSCLKFYLKNLCALIISYRVKNNRFYRLSFHIVSPLSYTFADWIMVFMNERGIIIHPQDNSMRLAGKNGMSRTIYDPETIHPLPDAGKPDAVFHHRIPVISCRKTG